MCETRKSKSALIAGTTLVVVGGLLLLNNFDVIEGYLIWKFWPLTLVAIGLAQFALSIGHEYFPDGLWLVFTGGWLYVSLQHVWGLGFGETWPLWLVAWGIAVVWRSFFKRRWVEESHHG